MSLTDGFPAVTGAADQFDIGKALAGLVVTDSYGTPRPGVFHPTNEPLLVSRADMGVDVTAFRGASVRGGRVILLTNEGSTPVRLAAAPSANSRIDVVYWKQYETAAPSSDTVDGPAFGVLPGLPAPIPTKPVLTIPGAVEIGTVEIPFTATSTEDTGVIITQTAPFTATTGGVVPVRNRIERDGWSPADGGRCYDLSDHTLYVRVAGKWERAWQAGVLPYAMAAGVASNPAGASTRINFPPGRFTVPPIIAMANTDKAVSQLNAQCKTTEYANIAGYSTGGHPIPTVLFWIAVQMTPISAAG